MIVEKFGLRGKHIAAEDEHVSDLSVRAAEALLEEAAIDPETIDVVMYYGSMWKDYAVWQAAPWIAHRIGATRAYAVEYDNVSCGHARRAAHRARHAASPRTSCARSSSSPRAASRTCSTTANERSRFMFNFGDGAVAGLLVKDGGRNELLGCHGVTDGSFSLQVKVPSGGSVSPNGGYRFLDVADPSEMKEGLDEVSLANFVARREGALERSGATLADVGYLCGIHMKPSMHRALVAELGLDASRAAYLDDTGHMSGVDPLLALDRAARAGELARRRARAAARRRHRLHVGGECRTVGR